MTALTPSRVVHAGSDHAHDAPAYRWSLHAIAILVALATFPLIFMGGLVTSHQAGMSVPDWPNTWGYNMFLLPPSYWLSRQAGGVFYEHTHRLMATLAGFASIILVMASCGPARTPHRRRLFLRLMLASLAVATVCGIPWAFLRTSDALAVKILSQVFVGFLGLASILLVAWLCRRPEPRRSVRWVAALILIAVIAQGVLGGLRVVLVNLDLAIVHGCFAQAFFCLTALMVAMTSRWWLRATHTHAAIDVQALRPVFRIAAVSVLIIYAQLMVGATMRHFQAGLAIPDMPLAYGHLLPPTDAAGLQKANDERILMNDPRIERVTLTQIWLHFSHRLGALAVSAALITLMVSVWRRARKTRLISLPVFLLGFLLITQLTLGWITVTNRKPADIASYHVAVGALILFLTFTVAVRARRLIAAAAQPEPVLEDVPAGNPRPALV